MLRSKLVLQLAFLLLIGAGIVAGVRLVRERQEIRKEAAAQPTLYIRNDKSYVKPGQSYSLVVLADYKNFIGYSGNLDVGSNCDSNGNTCTNVSPWKNFDGSLIYIQNGGITINVPSNATPFTATNVRFRPNPNPNSYGWSNPITMGVGETTGLMDTTKYLTMPNKPILYKGVNSSFENEAPTNFEMVIGFDEFANKLGGEDLRCGGPSGKVMYFIKSDPKAYWNPQTPWMNKLSGGWDPQHNYSKENLLWPLNYWRQRSGWYDNLIVATGDVKYNLRPNSPLTKENNFKSKTTLHKYGSNDPKLPHYFLTAKYVGNGWGLSNSKTLIVSATATTAFCNLHVSGNETESLWSVHADKTSLPGYSDVLRLKYYEAESGFITNRSKYALREDWYWAKGVGLVRIDVKNFCPNDYSKWGGPYSNCKPCKDDPDCLNEYIANPQITLKRVGPYVTPTDTPIPTPTDTPTPTPTKAPTPTPDVNCSLSAKPSSGNAPLNNVDLIGNVGGTATGNIRYRFDCTNNGTWESDNTTTTNLYTKVDLCDYTSSGNYTAKLRVNRDGVTSTCKTTVSVGVPPPTPTTTPTPTGGCQPGTVPGDANGDCKVDGFDYVIWWQNFGKNVTGGPSRGDFNRDGKVDGFDYVLWWQNFGT